MKPVRAALLVVLALSGAMTGVTLAAGVTTSSDAANADGDWRQTTSDGNGTSAASLGAKISAFMQSNAAEADGAVESGMWAASFERSRNESERAALVNMRTETLQLWLERIEERKRDLIERREAGEISRLKYESQMSALVGQYVSLLESINETQRRAEESDASAQRLAELREESKRVAGPEVAEAARTLGGAEAPGLGAGNVTDASATGNGTAANASRRAKNGNAGVAPGNGTAATPGSNATLGNATNATGNAGGVADNATGNAGRENATAGAANAADAAANATRNASAGVNVSDATNASAANGTANADPTGEAARGNGSVTDRNLTTSRPTRAVTATTATDGTTLADAPANGTDPPTTEAM